MQRLAGADLYSPVGFVCVATRPSDVTPVFLSGCLLLLINRRQCIGLNFILAGLAWTWYTVHTGYNAVGRAGEGPAVLMNLLLADGLLPLFWGALLAISAVFLMLQLYAREMCRKDGLEWQQERQALPRFRLRATEQRKDSV